MAKSYQYKETKLTTKKLAGIYDAERGIINVDGKDLSVLEELKDFECVPLEIVMKVKEETDLTDE